MTRWSFEQDLGTYKAHRSCCDKEQDVFFHQVYWLQGEWLIIMIVYGAWKTTWLWRCLLIVKTKICSCQRPDTCVNRRDAVGVRRSANLNQLDGNRCIFSLQFVMERHVRQCSNCTSYIKQLSDRASRLKPAVLEIETCPIISYLSFSIGSGGFQSCTEKQTTFRNKSISIRNILLQWKDCLFVSAIVK